MVTASLGRARGPARPRVSLRLAALSTGQVQAVPLDPGDRFQAEADGFPVLLEIGRVIPEFPFSTLAAS